MTMIITKNNFENLDFDHGYSINISYNNCPAQFPIHWHNYTELVYLPVDLICYTVNGDPFEILAGDILFIWPGELHSVLPNHKPNITICQFDSILLNTMKFLFKEHFSLIRNIRMIKSDGNPKMADVIASYLGEIKDIFSKENDFFCDPLMCVKLFEMFTKLCRMRKNEMQYKNAGNLIRNESTQKIAAACGYISNHFTRDLTLEEVSDFCGFSKYHFSRLFKEYTGTSFINYVTVNRLHYADNLLSNPSLSVTDIALQSGFGSISTFNRVFKQYKGCSPTQFRSLYHGPNNPRY